MKKTIFAIFAVAAFMLTSCGGAKTVTGSSASSPKEEGTEIKLNACQEFQLMDPGNRYAAKGDSWDLTRAQQAAEAAARNGFASMISTACMNAYRAGGDDYTVTASTQEETKAMSDGANTVSSFFQSASKETINDAVVVKMSQFKLDNGNYRVWVCLELRTGLHAALRKMADKVEQQIPDEDRLKNKYNRDSFIKEVEEKMQRDNDSRRQ